jgi:hypothetical protein
MNKAYGTVSVAFVLLLKIQLVLFFFNIHINTYTHICYISVFVCMCYTSFHDMWSVSPQHGVGSGCRWRRHPLDGDGSFEYIEYRVMDGSQRVILQLGDWCGANNTSL